MSLRASTGIVVSREWVKFQFLHNFNPILQFLGLDCVKLPLLQKKMHMNMTQKDVSFVQVDAAVTIKCWTSLLRDRKQPTAYQVFWTVCLCQTAFCFIFIQLGEQLQLLKSITAFKLTCLSAVRVHVLAPYDWFSLGKSSNCSLWFPYR